MKKRFRVALFAGILSAFVIAGYAYLSGPEGSVKAPAFKLARPDGSMWESSALGGRPAIVHFWAAWCPPCKEEILQFLEMAREVKGRIQFVAVSQDPKWDDVFALVPREQWPADVVLLLDPKAQVGERFGTFQLPETYAMGPEGEILRKWVGPQEWSAVKGQLAH